MSQPQLGCSGSLVCLPVLLVPSMPMELVLVTSDGAENEHLFLLHASYLGIGLQQGLETRHTQADTLPGVRCELPRCLWNCLVGDSSGSSADTSSLPLSSCLPQAPGLCRPAASMLYLHTGSKNPLSPSSLTPRPCLGQGSESHGTPGLPQGLEQGRPKGYLWSMGQVPRMPAAP